MRHVGTTGKSVWSDQMRRFRLDYSHLEDNPASYYFANVVMKLVHSFVRRAAQVISRKALTDVAYKYGLEIHKTCE